MPLKHRGDVRPAFGYKDLEVREKDWARDNNLNVIFKWVAFEIVRGHKLIGEWHCHVLTLHLSARCLPSLKHYLLNIYSLLAWHQAIYVHPHLILATTSWGRHHFYLLFTKKGKRSSVRLVFCPRSDNTWGRRDQLYFLCLGLYGPGNCRINKIYEFVRPTEFQQDP